MMIQVGDGPRGLRRRGTKQEEKKCQTGGKEGAPQRGIRVSVTGQVKRAGA